MIISVITCSINPVLEQQLAENIALTIGAEYEFIPFDNREKNWGICKVYNVQSQTAKGDIICFVHDDVRFITSNWGQILMDSFNTDPSIGLVGVAGAGYKTKLTAPWSASPPGLITMNVFQHYKFNEIPKQRISLGTPKVTYQEVVVLDGVFIAARRNIVGLFQFDEQLLDGFHGYDIDYSLTVGSKFRLIVNNSLELEHFSEGNTDLNWFIQLEKVAKKWKDILPKSIIKLNYLERQRQEYKAFLKTLMILKRSKNVTFSTLFNYTIQNFNLMFFLIWLNKDWIDKRISDKIKVCSLR